MKLLAFLLLFTIFFIQSIQCQVVINEVQTSNKGTLADEDGKYNDWFELYNRGNSTVNLLGYNISDDPENLSKWQFPSAPITPGGQLLVFASGKNRKSIVNHWETAVFAENYWHYFVGTQAPPSDWNSLAFNTSSWLQGQGGIGYGDNDDNTVISQTITVYMRQEFLVTDTSVLEKAILSMDYDDGFVAYLNGIEIARSNVIGLPPAYDETASASREALMYQGGIPESFPVSTALLHSAIVNGINVLAVETHNVDVTSSDLSSIPYLSFGIRNSNNYFLQVPSWFIADEGQLHTSFKLKHSGETLYFSDPGGMIVDTFLIPYSDLDHSFCRIPDGSQQWCVSNTPSPEESNNSSVCFSGYTQQPVFDPAPGFYPQGTMVTISAAGTGSEIHYTTNGNIPAISDPVFIQPFYLDSTAVIRARCFSSDGLLPGKTATSTFIRENRFEMPVISISTDSSNLWDYYTGIYVLGPNAEPWFPHFGANFWQDWEKDCHVEYFEPQQMRAFDLDAGLSIHGGWTRGLDQKSFLIETHSYYDSSSIHYRLFSEKPIIDFEGIVLSNSGNDWMNTHIRDALMQRSMGHSKTDYTAYQPSVVYLNGEYWGIYNIRERNNKDFIESNHGIPADSLDIIVNDGEVPEGTADAFWQMVNFITTHDLSVADNFNIASSYWNLENLADYFIAETYFVNNDWIGDWTNNIKLYRQRKQGSKWNYILWDLDFGLGLNSSYFENKLAVAMSPPVPTPHAEIFRRFLQNPEFRHYFINRYADLINTTFNYSSMQSILLDMQYGIDSEIPFAWQRWFGYDGTNEWLGNLGYVTQFILNRKTYALQYINSTFDLQGQQMIKLSIEPGNAGTIKINTIYPPSLPWLGVYFKGNPVTITAVPAPGYQFLYWEPNSYLNINDTSRSLTFDLTHYDTFKAVFSGNAESPKITVSEVNYNSHESIDAGDWIELHNYGDIELDLSDWHISDNAFYHDYEIPLLTRISPNGHLVIAEDTNLFHVQHPGISCLGPLGFSLSNDHDLIALSDYKHDTILSFTYSDSVEWLKTCDGLGRTMELKEGSLDPGDPSNWFAGCMGGSPGQSYHPCQERIVISEINYNSADWADPGDWVEIFNPGNYPVDLSGWHFSDSDDQHMFVIPSGTVVQGGDYLVLSEDMLKFTTRYPWIQNKRGPFSFGLSGSGEALRLYDQSGKIEFSVIYNDNPPWPTEADGEGYTLESSDVHGKVCEGDNWFAGCPEGSPAGPYIFPCHTGLPRESETAFSVFPNPASTYLYVLSNTIPGKTVKISITDALGRTMLEKELDFGALPSTRLELTGLDNGMYQLKINYNNQAKPFVEKVVISR
jgi:hypothetical protein